MPTLPVLRGDRVTLRPVCDDDAGALLAQGHHRFTIDPAVANERAIRAYAKLGFRSVGVMRAYELGADGTWHDGRLMDLLAGELL
jgi:aminoglycoside 6'-N-acetyltransferase